MDLRLQQKHPSEAHSPKQLEPLHQADGDVVVVVEERRTAHRHVPQRIPTEKKDLFSYSRVSYSGLYFVYHISYSDWLITRVSHFGLWCVFQALAHKTALVNTDGESNKPAFSFWFTTLYVGS